MVVHDYMGQHHVGEGEYPPPDPFEGFYKPCVGNAGTHGDLRGDVDLPGARVACNLDGDSGGGGRGGGGGSHDEAGDGVREDVAACMFPGAVVTDWEGL